jgi:hypothetical protein
VLIWVFHLFRASGNVARSACAIGRAQKGSLHGGHVPLMERTSCMPELRRRSIRDTKRVKLPVLMFKVLYEAPDFPLAPSVAVESAHRSVFILMTCF